MQRPNVAYLFAVLSLTTHLGCGKAEAMGKKPSASPPAENHLSTDRHRKGWELGTQNGERMVGEVRRATIDARGCQGQPAYEKALLAVVKAIRPPKPGDGEDLEFARGFFAGYSTAFGRALRSGRVDCELPTVLGGALPGTVVGTLLCGAGNADVKLLDLIEVEPIYAGWTGGRYEAESECGKVAMSFTQACNIGNEEDREKIDRIVRERIHAGCAD